MAGGVCVFLAGALDAVNQSALVFLSKEENLNTAPQLTRLLYILYSGMIQPGVMAMGIAIYLIAIAAACLRGAVGARWVGWMSLAFGLTSTLGGVVALTLTNGGNTPPASATRRTRRRNRHSDRQRLPAARASTSLRNVRHDGNCRDHRHRGRRISPTGIRTNLV